jgi:putative transposase
LKKSKFTEAQIAFALKQAESGIRVEEVCRKFGISQATFFNWKKSTVAWAPMSCVVCANLRTKTDISNNWWLT